MQVRLHNPRRTVEVAGPRTVRDLVVELGMRPGTVLVIRDDSLVTGEAVLADTDAVEIRPVISGG